MPSIFASGRNEKRKDAKRNLRHKQKIERYSRDQSGSWVLAESEPNNPTIALVSINCLLSHVELYDKVEDI